MKGLIHGLLLMGLTAASAVAGSLPDLWFPVGESLTYDMTYGMVPVGQCVVTSEWINEEGKTRLAIRFVTKTNKFFDKIYQVDDVVEAIIDPETFLPVRMHKQLHEGNFTSVDTVTYDHANNVAHWHSFLTRESKDFKISPDTRDIVSFMFLMRKEPLERGKLGSYWVAGDDGLCRLTLRGGKVEDVQLDTFGTVATTRVRPDVGADSMFLRKMPNMVWISNDPRRILVRMNLKLPVASVTMSLSSVGGPGDDFWTRKSLKNGDAVLAHD